MSRAQVSRDLPRLLASTRLVSVGLRRALLLVPVAGLVALSLLWPILSVLLRSLRPDGQVQWTSPVISMEHYSRVLTDDTLQGVIVHTFFIAAWTTVLTTALAFPVAYLISRLPRRAGTVLLAVVLLQFWVSILVRLFAYTQILGREGVINRLAEQLGAGPFDLLFNTGATVVGMVVYLLPYMVLILYAGMSGIDHSLVTAAKTLGASSRQAFWRIYVPLVRPTVTTGALLVLVLSLGFFLTPAVLGGPQDTTVAIYIQQQIDTYRWGTASVIGILLLVVTVVGYAMAVRIGGTAAVLPGAGGAGKGTAAAEPLRFGRSSVFLWTMTVLVLGMMLLPLLIVAQVSFTETSRLVWPPQGFTGTWYTQVLQSPLWMNSLRKSAVVAFWTGMLATLIGLLLARVMLSLRSPTSRALFASAVYAPLVVPVILLAIGIFDTQAQFGLLGTTHGLVLAHVVIAFPFAFAILVNALSGVDSSIEPAAWTLGASRRRAFWTAVMPTILPSLLGAFLIAFITSWDEPVIALFQTGFEKTLPVTLFSQMKSGVTPELAAVATMLVGLVLVLLLVAVTFSSARRRRRAHRRAIPLPSPE